MIFLIIIILIIAGGVLFKKSGVLKDRNNDVKSPVLEQKQPHQQTPKVQVNRNVATVSPKQQTAPINNTITEKFARKLSDTNTPIIGNQLTEVIPEPVKYYFPKNYVVVDIETEGFDVLDDQIIQIAAIRVVDGEITDNKFNEFNVTAQVSGWLSENSDITQAKVKQSGIEPSDMIDKFRQFIKPDDILVGHNLGFDLDFLRYNFHKYGQGDLKNVYVDTLAIGKYFANSDFTSHKVSDYIQNVSSINEKELSQHNAMHDVLIEKQIFDYERACLGDDWHYDELLHHYWMLPKYQISGYFENGIFNREAYKRSNRNYELESAQIANSILNDEPIKYYFPRDYVLFDIKVSGNSISRGDIVQVAAIRVKNYRLTNQRFNEFNINATVPYILLRDSDITQAMVESQGIPLEDIAQKFRKFLKPTDVIVGHDVGKALSFMRYTFHKFGLGNIENSFIHTWLIGIYYSNRGFGSHNLEAYVDQYPSINKGNLPIYNAYNDVIIMNDIFTLERSILGNDWIGKHYVEGNWGIPSYGIEKNFDKQMTMDQIKVAERLAIDEHNLTASNALLDELLTHKSVLSSRLFKRKAMNLKELGRNEELLKTLSEWETHIDKISQVDQKWIAKCRETIK